MLALLVTWLATTAYQNFNLSSLAEAQGPCAQLLTPTEVASLGSPHAPFAILDEPRRACALDNQRRGGKAEYGIEIDRAKFAQENLKKGSAVPLKGCGIPAWSVDQPDARVLVLISGSHGASIRFAKSVFAADVPRRACQLVAPRVVEILANFDEPKSP